jgi:hypothetical protein
LATEIDAGEPGKNAATKHQESVDADKARNDLNWIHGFLPLLSIR